MSIIRFEKVVKHIEDKYVFNLADIAVGIKGVYFIGSDRDDKSDFDLMIDRFTSHNKYEFKNTLSYIIKNSYLSDSIASKYGCSTIDDEHQYLEIEVTTSEFGKYKLIVVVKTDIEEDAIK